jgi:hypothetical protein
MIVRSVVEGRVGVCMMYASHSEEREYGVGVGVNSTTSVVRNTTSHRTRRICRKGVSVTGKTMTLCADDSEECENGVGVRNTSSHRPRRI